MKVQFTHKVQEQSWSNEAFLELELRHRNEVRSHKRHTKEKHCLWQTAAPLYSLKSLPTWYFSLGWARLLSCEYTHWLLPCLMALCSPFLWTRQGQQVFLIRLDLLPLCLTAFSLFCFHGWLLIWTITYPISQSSWVCIPFCHKALQGLRTAHTLLHSDGPSFR